MVYGDRAYGTSRYGRLQSLTYTRIFSESLYLESSAKALNLIEKNYSESLGLSEERLLNISVFYNESISYDDVYSRQLEAIRSPSESIVFDSTVSRTADLQRVYIEGLELEDLTAEKAITKSYKEELYIDTTPLKTVEIIRNEDLILEDEGSIATLLERLYTETIEFSTNQFFTSNINVVETLELDSKDLILGDTLVRRRIIEESESIGLTDDKYRIQTIRPVDIPEFMFQLLEFYDLYGELGEPDMISELGEPEMDVELIEDERED